MHSDVQVAREFLRVSYDKSGRERSNEEQHDDNGRAWPGWEWGKPYREQGSASRYASKPRDDFPVLLADLEADRFGAEALVMWEPSRGSRKVSEWCHLIELCEVREVKIAVTTHHRVYDPSNARDVRSLIDDANDSQYESAKISMRVKRSTAASAQAGRPSGQVPYGYQRVYGTGGRLVSQEIKPDEAALLVELLDRLVKGHSFKAIVSDWEARGVRTRKGRPFTHHSLRAIARNPLYIGKRVYVPGRNGRESTTPETMRRSDAVVTDATWPAIVDERTWRAVQSILEDPSRSTLRPGAAVHLLGGIARCDDCGGPLYVKYRKQGRGYMCQKRGCVLVNADELEELATAAMLAYLSRPDNYEALTAGSDDAEALEVAKTETARIRAERDELYDELGDGKLTAAAAARSEPQILARLKAAEDREAELSTPSVLRGLIEPGEDVAARWHAAPMSTRREIARLLLAPPQLGQLRVRKAGAGGNARIPAAERVTWRQAEV